MRLERGWLRLADLFWKDERIGKVANDGLGSRRFSGPGAVSAATTSLVSVQSKRSFDGQGVPKWNLGTRLNSGTSQSRVLNVNYTFIDNHRFPTGG